MTGAHPQLWLCLGCGRAGSVTIEDGDSLHLVAMRVQDAHRGGLLRACSDDNVMAVNHDLEAEARQLEGELAGWIGRFNDKAKAEERERVRAENAEREMRLLYEYLSKHEFVADGIELGERHVLDLDMKAIDGFMTIIREMEAEEFQPLGLVEESTPSGLKIR